MGAQWDQVKEILALALEQAPEERDQFVRQACHDDAALRLEVESLLSHHDQADSLLENSPMRPFIGDTAAWTGRRLGTYRIIREIGHGGMAVVYLAERDDHEFQRRVAIKMLRPGLQTAELLQRFRNERQALAALDHPNIVKLLDGGSTDDGLPYLVMDYVEGSPIDEFCVKQSLSLTQRLELFLKVCAAVQYAHEQLVVHRDLKPPNILITKDGVPRLLDFGIAKLLNPDYQETPLVTRSGWLPMTPEYASPEQLRGGPAGNSSDVYSLGILLYELLVGQRPFQSVDRSRAGFERLICEQEPETPSLAARRRGDAVSRALKGDLDNIVSKALRKEPDHRYASVAQFSDDLERHLTGRPVLARNLTPAYRTGRFLRRHKESVTTAAVVLAVMAAIGIWQLHNISNKASGVRSLQVAPVEQRRSVAVLGFKNLSGLANTAWLSTALSEMLSTELAAGEQVRTVPRETVARTKIDLALLNAESVPATALERIRKNLGSQLIVVGAYLDSGTANGGQIRLNVRLQDTTTGETIAAASEIGFEARLSDLAFRTGARLRERLGLSGLSELESQQIRAAFPSNPDAIRLYSQGLAKLQSMDALSARDLLAKAVSAEPAFPLAHAALAAAWVNLGYDAKAREQARQALDNADQLSREDHLLVEAGYYQTIADWPKAIETYQVLVSSFPDSPEYALSLAGAQASGGKGKDALNTLAALSRTDLAAKDDPRIDLGIALAAASFGDSKLRRDAAGRAAVKAERQGARLLLGRARTAECRALANLGENERAKTVCEEGRRISAEVGDRGGLARALHAMAEVPLNQGDFARAGNLYKQALALMREIGDRQGVATELVNLGLIEAKRGNFSAAHKMYAESFRAYEQSGDKNGMAVASGNLGNLLLAEGNLAEALRNYQRVLALSNESGHRSSAAHALENIGNILADQGDFTGAYKMYDQTLAIQQEAGERSSYAETLVSVGEAVLQQGDMVRAAKLLDQALVLQEALHETGSAAETRVALAELNYQSGRPKDAEQLARSALAEFQKQKQPDKMISALAWISRALLQQGNTLEASKTIATASEIVGANPNVMVRRSLALARARVLAANNNTAAAERIARQVWVQTGGSNVRMRLEAALVLGEIQMKRKASDGRKNLKELAKSARAKGFELIARQCSRAGDRPNNLTTAREAPVASAATR